MESAPEERVREQSEEERTGALGKTKAVVEYVREKILRVLETVNRDWGVQLHSEG